jgi:hypothetical protein
MRVQLHSFNNNSTPELLHKITTSIRLSLLRWHHLPRSNIHLMNLLRWHHHYGFNAGIPEFTLVLNYNTLPTIRNTELIRLNTRWFQRKQFRSKRVCITYERIERLMARSDTGSTCSDTNYNGPTKISRIFSQDINN